MPIFLVRHGWNLNIMQHNQGSLLTQIQPLCGEYVYYLFTNTFYIHINMHTN